MKSHCFKELKEVDPILVEEDHLEDWIREYLEEARLHILQLWNLKNNWRPRYGNGNGDCPYPQVDFDDFVENEEDCHCNCCYPHRDWHIEVDVEAAVGLIRTVAAILIGVTEQAICEAAPLTRVAHPPEESIPLLLGIYGIGFTKVK